MYAGSSNAQLKSVKRTKHGYTNSLLIKIIEDNRIKTITTSRTSWCGNQTVQDNTPYATRNTY